jgi:hypothetical protein
MELNFFVMNWIGAENWSWAIFVNGIVREYCQRGSVA